MDAALITLLVLTACVASGQLGKRVTVGPLKPMASDLSIRAPMVCGSRRGAVCHDDCSTLMTCGGNGTPLHSQTCESLFPGRSYCVKNACTDKPDTSNAQCGNSFTCTSEGVFPDPSNAMNYFYCSGADAVSENYACGTNTIFNTRQATCVRGTSNPASPPIDCSRSSNMWVAMRTHPAYYAFCAVTPMTGQRQTIMFKCMDEINEAFDVTTNTCSYQCRQLGNFVDRENCRGYIMCTISAGRWAPIKQTCPTRHNFNARTNRCEIQTTECLAEIVPPTLPPPTKCPPKTTTPATTMIRRNLSLNPNL